MKSPLLPLVLLLAGAMHLPAAVAQSGPRIQTLKTADKTVDIRNLPGNTVLTGSSGKTISVDRIRQLQARIDAHRPTPVVVATPGQSLKTLATAAPGTRVVLPGGKVARSQDLAKIAALQAKLATKRVPKPAPIAASGNASGVVGQGGLTMADALKRPANEVIQVGSRKYSVDQLKQIDASLRASPREPKGLTERVTTRSVPAQPAGPRVAVAKNTPLAELLAKPDNTVLQTPGGKTATVGQIKQYMAQQKLTPAQLESKFRGAK